MSHSNNEVIDSFDGSRYEITTLFMEGMVDAGFGINRQDISPTIENNNLETLRFDYDEGYSFASDLMIHFREHRDNTFLIYVRKKEKAFEPNYLFSLIATDSIMAGIISRSLNKYYLDLQISHRYIN